MNSAAGKKSVPVFHMRDVNTVWRTVLHLATRQKVSKGYVWGFDGNQQAFSFLHAGQVRLSYTSRHGVERIVLYMDAGCIFRELGAFYTPGYHPTNIQAEAASEVYHFPASLVRDTDFVRQYPELMINLVESLSFKAGALYTQLVEGGDHSPGARVCRYIAQLVEKHAGATAFAPDLSQGCMAQALGLHRSTLCRAIKDLRELGVLGEFSRRRLEVLDLPHLLALSK